MSPTENAACEDRQLVRLCMGLREKPLEAPQHSPLIRGVCTSAGFERGPETAPG
jgi:hypothetical protein